MLSRAVRAAFAAAGPPGVASGMAPGVATGHASRRMAGALLHQQRRHRSVDANTPATEDPPKILITGLYFLAVWPCGPCPVPRRPAAQPHCVVFQAASAS